MIYSSVVIRNIGYTGICFLVMLLSFSDIMTMKTTASFLRCFLLGFKRGFELCFIFHYKLGKFTSEGSGEGKKQSQLREIRLSIWKKK